MDDNKPYAVPLVEQLRSIPIDAKLRIDTPNALGCMDTRSIPVGRLCHEAAETIAAPLWFMRLKRTSTKWGAWTEVDAATVEDLRKNVTMPIFEVRQFAAIRSLPDPD